MTEAELKLCRDIAKAEGKRVDGERYADGCRFPLLETYLTDPAETLRMEKELLRAGWFPGHHDGFFWRRAVHFDLEIFEDKEYETATAKAYLAMLLASTEA